MSTEKETTRDNTDRELVMTRLLDAPVNLVWDAFTQPEQVKHWWGPNGFTNTILEMEVKPGGVWRFMMHGPNGVEYPNRIVFTEVIKQERLCYTHSSENEIDSPVFHTEVTFEKQGTKTLVTMKGVFATVEEKERVVKELGALEGGNQMLRKLDEFLGQQAKKIVTVERLLQAPVELVWKALTDQQEMKQWYFDLEAFSPVIGFEFQFYGEGLKGERYLHCCKITDLIPLQRIRYSWCYEGYPGESFVTFTLSEENGMTRIRVTHEGLDTFPAGNSDFDSNNFVMGWTELIGTQLKNYLAKIQQDL